MTSTQTSCSLDSTQSEGNSGDEDENDEMLDPRVKVELESLNSATSEINDVEQELEEMHAVFRQTLTESAFVLKTQANILGKCVKKARPYYEKLGHAKKLQVETQKAALNYERSCSQHQAAKVAVAHAEQKLASTPTEHKTLDPTWQEMLNRTIKKVMDSEIQKQQSEMEHLLTAQRLTKANKEISEMKIKLKSSISKSRIYYDLRNKYMDILEGHKQKIIGLQQQLKNSKQNYSSSLRKLESISDEIHELRKSQMDLTGPRQDGVGAECVDTILEGDISTEDNVNLPDCTYQDDSNEYDVKIDDIEEDDVGQENDKNTDDKDDTENDELKQDSVKVCLPDFTEQDNNNDLKNDDIEEDDVGQEDDKTTDDKDDTENDESKQDNVELQGSSIVDNKVCLPNSTEQDNNNDLESDEIQTDNVDNPSATESS